MHRYSQERKITAGLDHSFGFRPRDGYLDSSPTLTVYWPAPVGTKSYALSPVRAADVIVDVSDNGRDITIESTDPPGAALRGAILELGGYLYIDGGAVYQATHRVVQLVSQAGPAAGIYTTVLRLAEPIRADARPVTVNSGATGQLARTVRAFAAGDAFAIYGTQFTYADNGGAGNDGLEIDIGGDPTDLEMAERVAAAINDASIGVTATPNESDVDLVGGADDPIDGLPAFSPYAATGMSGATDVGKWRARWTMYTGTIPDEDIGTSGLRNVKWEVPFTPRWGADVPGLQRRHRGFIHVCTAPFDTGLDDVDLFRYVPGWSAIVPDRQASWAEQRWEAEEELVARMRPRLDGRSEDDVLSEQFRRAHALFTASLILRGQAALGYATADQAEELHKLALEALELALGCLTWLDKNGNAIVDSGETGVARAGLTNAIYATCFDDDDVTQAEIASHRAGRYDDR